MKRSVPTLVISLMFAVLCSADSVSNASLNFGAATFSGPVAPSTGIGIGGIFAGDATITDADGFYSSLGTYYSNEKGVVGWNPLTSAMQVTPLNFSIATASSDPSLSTTASSGDIYNAHAQVDRFGTITTTDGNVGISIPYSFSVTSNAGYIESSQVYLELSSYDPATGFHSYGNVGDTFLNQFSAVNHNETGVLTLDLNGLAPGNYTFDAGVASSTTSVAEPSTGLLLGTGILVAWLLRKKCLTV